PDKLSDYTALSVLEFYSGVSGPVGSPPIQQNYKVPLLQRWPLGTLYAEIPKDLTRFLQSPQLHPRPLLVIDTTGVGLAVVEMVHEHLRRAGVVAHLATVTITSGQRATRVGGGRYNVAKGVLVSVLQVLFGSRRLRVARELPEAATLVRELQTFQV